jgi:hypothetical protein
MAFKRIGGFKVSAERGKAAEEAWSQMQAWFRKYRVRG